jgi:hypothetical protein
MPLYHTCGYPLVRILPRSVHRTELVLWIDAEKDSPTFRQEITHCPRCGAPLHSRDVIPPKDEKPRP